VVQAAGPWPVACTCKGPGRRLGVCLAFSKTKPHAAGAGAAPWGRLEKEERLLEPPNSPQQGSEGQRKVKEGFRSPYGHACVPE
jgi:hypothetical protein